MPRGHPSSDHKPDGVERGRAEPRQQNEAHELSHVQVFEVRKQVHDEDEKRREQKVKRKNQSRLPRTTTLSRWRWGVACEHSHRGERGDVKGMQCESRLSRTTSKWCCRHTAEIKRSEHSNKSDEKDMQVRGCPRLNEIHYEQTRSRKHASKRKAWLRKKTCVQESDDNRRSCTPTLVT